jgi:hypothetical protein
MDLFNSSFGVQDGCGLRHQRLFHHEAHEEHEGKTSLFKTFRGLRALRGKYRIYASKNIAGSSQYL